ncbi:uncharacterized protein B0H18DRAFT_1127286 [Fomitopsis serialis]|uniref:uncharacterized protein n=1 Tax=Fomitopsis serialis TaxID=139415 RepID=UPI0020086F97|nr:uncharacterized protein B0H18DRAFT_1127286 [Neoantrodia serialis]KAH9912367.1 hypothetical protein B0H18DRAFT_1127286 [Neoantrodia serialis]
MTSAEDLLQSTHSRTLDAYYNDTRLGRRSPQIFALLADTSAAHASYTPELITLVFQPQNGPGPVESSCTQSTTTPPQGYTAVRTRQPYILQPSVVLRYSGRDFFDVRDRDSIGLVRVVLHGCTGDMVFENACLFLRDALVLREFSDAIKAGDSGRIILVLKVLALSYRGSGRTKYAQETLHVIHNLTHIWPKPLRTIVINNWLVNTTGKPNHWYPVDLLQEHNIFWTKRIYSAQGSGASWDWLEITSPCIGALRHLVTSMNDALGSRQGIKHAEPDLRRDIEELRRSLADANVYRVEPGRVIDGEKAVTPNVVAVGVSQLLGPLGEYNAMFARLRKRRARTSPLVGGTIDAPGTATARDDSPGSDVTTDSDHANTDANSSGDEDMMDIDDGVSDGEEEDADVNETEYWLEHEPWFTLDEEADVDPYLD